MNAEDRKAFEEWDKGFEKCKCAACIEHRMRTLYPIWNAALEYERSRQHHPTTEELTQVLVEIFKDLKFRYGDNPPVDILASRLLTHLRSSPSEELEKLKARIAELEAAKPVPAPEPERVFTPCSEHYLATSNGEHWEHCPWCSKSLWRTQKVVEIEREMRLRREEDTADGWNTEAIAHYRYGIVATNKGSIIKRTTITFEVEE